MIPYTKIVTGSASTIIVAVLVIKMWREIRISTKNR